MALTMPVHAAPDVQTVEAAASPNKMPAASAAASASESPVPSAAHVKAEYLCRFLTYVELPAAAQPAPNAPLVIGVMEADDVFNELGDILRGRTVEGRPLSRLHLAEGDSLAGVHLLYVGHKVDMAQSGLVKVAKSSPILLVSDTPDGLERGAIFNFLTTDRVRFEISLRAAEHAAIRVSSRILAVSERVTGGR